MPPIRQAMSIASAKVRMGMASPRQSCTLLRPASRSMQSVTSGGRVFSSEVLPTPLGPNSAMVVLPFASARRRSAVIILRPMADSPAARRSAAGHGARRNDRAGQTKTSLDGDVAVLLRTVPALDEIDAASLGHLQSPVGDGDE